MVKREETFSLWLCPQSCLCLHPFAVPSLALRLTGTLDSSGGDAGASEVGFIKCRFQSQSDSSAESGR